MDQQGEAWDFATAPPGVAPGVSSMVGYRTMATPTEVHRGLPSSRLTFILSLDEGVEAVAAGADLVGARPTPLLLAGLHTSPSKIRQRQGQAGVQLALHPLAARPVLGVPAAELSVTDFDASEVLGRWGVELQERTSDARTWDDRFGRVAAELAHQLVGRESTTARVRPEIFGAWHLLERSGGTMPIGDVAERVNLGVRQLGTLFHQELGRSPKQIAGLMRFDRSVAEIAGRLRRHAIANLADVAVAAGFSDQAHFTREFTRYAGVGPRQWMAEELRIVQDGGHAEPADWDHG